MDAIEYIPDIKSVLYHNYTKLTEMLENKGKMRGIPTGFTELDKLLHGLQPKTLTLIGARPAMGKTSFALNIVRHVAVKEKKPVLIFSGGISKEELVNRIVCSEAGINFEKICSGEFTNDDRDKFLSVIESLSDAHIYIDDTPFISIEELASKAKRLKSENDIELIVVDYIQLINNDKRLKRQFNLAEISGLLKKLANELSIPIIAISQLSRATEGRKDHRPMLSDLRMNKRDVIENYADTIILLYRDEYYNSETTDKPNIAECIVAKNKMGETGMFEMSWLGKYVSFYNLEEKS